MEKRIKGTPYVKGFLMIKLQISYYPNQTGFDTPNVAAKKDLTALEAEVDKLDINILVNVPTSLNDPKPKVDRWLRCWWVESPSYRLKQIKWSSK